MTREERSKLTIKRIPGKRVLTAGVVTLLAAGLAACSSSNSNSPSSGSSGGSNNSSSQPPLVMESSPEDNLADNFNPFDQASPIQGMGATGLVYEPLYQFNLANPSTAPYPWLATAYSWGSGGKSITFTIRQGVKWNDGQAFSADDVAFTFNYIKQYANSKTDDINLGGLSVSSVSESGNKVTINFASPQYMNLLHIASQIILPKHIWSSITNPAHFTDPKPVGTGPYTLASFTSQGYTMQANPSYWQPVPVKKVYFPDYTTNNAAQTALFSGKIDWTGNYIPNLQKNFIDKDPAHNVAYEGSNSSGALYPNLKTGPTADLAVRQAIDVAINRQLMATEGESGLEDPVLNVSGITQPAYTPWLSPSLANKNLAPAGDPAQAASILTKAGYKKDSAGFFAKNGQELSIAITTPGDYSDFANDVSLAVQSLKQAGIKASFNNVTVDTYNSDAQNGNFQLLLRWGQGGITPYQLYDGWLDPVLIGSGNGNYERFNNPTITAELSKLNGDQTIAQQTADLAPIEKYVADNLPVIPTTTSAEWCEYTSVHYTGWPTKSNPYESCQPSGTNLGAGGGTDEYVLLHLKPA
jgi:peptide/nickel transport system substrate-binding protein